MNTKGIIWKPICMLNAGEGTFCNAGVWVMLQLSPTLFLGGYGWRDCAAAVLVSVPLCHLCLSPSPPRTRAPRSHPSSLCQKPALLTINEFFSPLANKMLQSLFPPSVVWKWEDGDKVQEWGERETGRDGKWGDHSHWQLCLETIAVFLRLNRVSRQFFFFPLPTCADTEVL